MKVLHVWWLRFQLARMRERHVELVARAMEHTACEAHLASLEYYRRAELLCSEIVRHRRRITRLECCRC